jgi:arylsulfatase
MRIKQGFVRKFLGAVCAAGLVSHGAAAETAGTNSPPNIVFLLADDAGWGDVGVYGAKSFTTPNLDRMAAEGTRFTRFYVAQPVCSASRAALLTGCYPNRIGIQGALGPSSKVGISSGEMTLAEMLKQRGYATAIYGKWHLGFQKQFLPTRHGFDEYFGLPYSNDMWPLHPDYLPLAPGQPAKKGGYPDLPLIEGDRVVIPEVTSKEQRQLTTWYTEHAVSFVARNKERPFFLYVPYAMPHVPLHVSDKFKGKSKLGLYGDVMEEIDWSVGEILKAVRENGLDDRTLVMFASDNGPWLSYGNHGGSSGGLREGKGTTWEGGVREPFIARWPDRIPPGIVCREPAMTIDILPTVARLTGAALPALKIDGLDIWPLMSGKEGAANPHDAYYFYYNDNELWSVMSGRWKLQLPHKYNTLEGAAGGNDGRPAPYKQRKVEKPELYDLENDPDETTDVAAGHPEMVERLGVLVEKARTDMGDALTGRPGNGRREPGRVMATPQ